MIGRMLDKLLLLTIGGAIVFFLVKKTRRVIVVDHEKAARRLKDARQRHAETAKMCAHFEGLYRKALAANGQMVPVEKYNELQQKYSDAVQLGAAGTHEQRTIAAQAETARTNMIVQIAALLETRRVNRTKLAALIGRNDLA